MRVKANPFLLLTLTVLFWSANFVMGRAINNSVPPISLAFWRWLLALLILLPISLPHVRAQWPLIRQSFSLLAVYGVLGVSLFNTFVYISLHYTTATNALLINSIVPILIVLISYLQGVTQVSSRQIVGIAMSLAGVLTIICRAEPSVLLTLQVNRGDLWILMAVICWSLYTILLRKRPPELHPLSFLASIVAIGMVPLSMLYVWEFIRIGGFDVNLVNSSSILYMALFPSVICFIFWNQAVREVGPDKAGLFLYLMPVFGAILSAVFLGESFRTFHLIGSVLIFAGIHLTTRVPANGKS